MRTCLLVVAVVCLAAVSAATASDDTIKAQARIGYAELQRDEAAISAATARIGTDRAQAGRDLIAAAATLAADMRVARAAVFAELPTSPAGRIGRSLLVQGFVALAAQGEWEIQYGRAVIDGATAGTREALASDAAARLAEGTRLVHRGLALV